MRAHFELVIFDADGVLVDTEPQSCRIWSSALSEIGLHMTADEVGELFTGLSDADALAFISKLLNKPLPPLFLDTVARRELDLFHRELQPIHGVIDVLNRIKARTCVASSGTYEKLDVTLGTTGLLDRFAGRIFSATDVKRGKPAPDIYLYAARQMGVRPSLCAVIEDSVLGVRAGVAAGMTVFGYAATTDPVALAAAGALTFENMNMLPPLLGDEV